MFLGQRRLICAVWAIGLCVLLITPAPALAGEFRASVVKVDITPDKVQWLAGYALRQSTGARDHIFHRIVALDDGQTQFFLVSSDLAAFPPSVYKETADRLQVETGIKPEQVWWAVTHTHSAPEVGPPGLAGVFLPERFRHHPNTEYTDWIERQLIEGIKQARATLAPARLGVGWSLSRANINRRAHGSGGTTFLGMDPDGPTDRQIGLLRLERANGSLLAIVANYPMHGTVLSRSITLISGDAPGVVARYVEEQLGAPMLYINGAAGNLGPIYSVPSLTSEVSANYRYLEQFRVLLGDKIIEAARRISATTSDVHLSLGKQIMETPRKPGLNWPDDLAEFARTTSTGENLVRFPVQILRINNDIAIWSAPVEMFCEISNEVRSHSRFPYTFYFGYSNGWLGYMPSKEEYPKGGYELGVSPFTAQAQADMVHAVLAYLDGTSSRKASSGEAGSGPDRPGSAGK